MKNKTTCAVLVLVAILVVTGCTQKKNLTGTSDSDLRPISMVLGQTWLTDAYSYQDTLANNGSVASFSAGMRSGNSAVGLLTFEGFGDSVICDSASIQLVIEDHSSDAGQSYYVAKVLQEWTESEVTWDEASEDTPWEEPRWEVLNLPAVQAASNDTLLLPLPANLVQSWIDGDTLNFGIALLSDEEGICQFYSSEDDDYYPTLLVYHTESDTVAVQTVSATIDAFIYSEEMQAGRLPADCIASILPTRLFTQWDLSLEAFNANLPDSLSIADSTMLRRCTINRAELVIPIDSTLSFIPEDAFTVYSYLVVDSVCVDSLPISSYHMKTYAYTDIGSYDDGELTVDYTPIVQALLAGYEENHGFMAYSLSEDKNMGKLVFGGEMQLRMIVTRPPEELE